MEKEKTLSIHARMALIKKELSNKKIPKSGHNKFAGFKYHELDDFIQLINELNEEHGVNDVINIDEQNGRCSITLYNSENSEDNYTIVTPFREAEMLGKGGAKSTVDAVQRMGSTITYNRRYLYMTAYNIKESDGVDSVEPNGSNTEAKQPKKKGKLTEERFQKALDLLWKKETTVAKIEEYDLTQEQKDKLLIFPHNK